MNRSTVKLLLKGLLENWQSNNGPICQVENSTLLSGPYFTDILGETFFIGWITLPTDLKNWDFQKKKKKTILPNIATKLLVFGVIGNHFENYYFETSLRFSKLCKNYDK